MKRNVILYVMYFILLVMTSCSYRAIPLKTVESTSYFVLQLEKADLYYPKEKVLEDWNESQHLDNEGITVNEFLENQKQETVKEAAEKFYPPKTTDLICSPKLVRDSFIAGAKWQQKQDKNRYSEEDLREAFRQGEQNISYSETYGLDSELTEQQWFEQFKK